MSVDAGDARAAADELPDEAWITALSCLHQMGPARLAALLADAQPAAAWRAVSCGLALERAAPRLLEALGRNPPHVVASWQRSARALDPTTVWARHVAAGLGVSIRSSASYPTAFLDDPEAPSIVYSVGDPDALVGPRVAIVGTRDCTRYGYDLARTMGAELSEAGVAVVSGLALGVDGAAHAGALAAGGAPPIAVVGTGLDVVYPRRNVALWRQVAEAGVLLSEYPLGEPPLAWHFPARNRLLAALADVVVVVESQEAGGSMITAREAVKRDVDVMAVPGPVTSKVSAGTNQLLSDGALVVRDTTDVLIKLNMSPGSRRRAAERRPPPSPSGQVVLDAFDWQPATLDHLVVRTGSSLVDLALTLEELSGQGWVEQRGGWYERVAKPGG